MNSEAFLYLAPLITGTIVSLLLVWMIYPRRSSPMIRTFIFLLLAAGFWSFAYAMELWSGSYSTSFFWRRIKYFGIVFIPVLWAVFAFQYAGKDRWVNRRTFVLLSIIPVFTLIMLWTNDYHSLYYAEISSAEWGPFSGIDNVEGPLYWVFTTYTYILLMVGNVLILRGAVTAASIYTRQSLAAVCGILIPLIGNLLYIVGMNPFPFRYDITPSLFVISGMVFWGSIIRFRFLDIVPIARETLVENFSDPIFVLDSKNRIIDVNPVAREIIASQITPHPTTNVIGERATDVFSHLPELLGKCQDVKKMRSEIELTLDKKTRYYDIEVSPVYRQKQVFLGRLITLKDITERKQVEQALRKNEEKLRNIFENSTNLFYSHTTDHRLTYLSPQVEEILGYTSEEAMVKWTELASDNPVNEKGFEHTLKAIETGRPQPPYELELVHRSGKKVWVEVREAPVVENGKTVSIVGALTDISERKRAEEDRKRLNKELIQKNKELEQIIYASGHDIRTPLVNVQGFGKELESSLNRLETILRDENVPSDIKEKLKPLLDEDFPESLQYIQDNISKIDSLNDALLHFSRVGQIKLEIDTQNMNELMQEIVRSLRYQIDAKGITISIDDLPSCFGDKLQINRIFTNLLDNSIRYISPERSGTISISGKIQQENSIFCVEDNGIGIDPNQFDSIFRLFRRLHPGESDGEGIGLTMAKQIIERHHGDIWVESEPGVGSKFFVSLPHEAQ